MRAPKVAEGDGSSSVLLARQQRRQEVVMAERRRRTTKSNRKATQTKEPDLTLSDFFRALLTLLDVAAEAERANVRAGKAWRRAAALEGLAAGKARQEAVRAARAEAWAFFCQSLVVAAATVVVSAVGTSIELPNSKMEMQAVQSAAAAFARTVAKEED